MGSVTSKPYKLPGIKFVIGILSGKGGTGKTFLATNLAALIAKAGSSVGLFDADITCPGAFRALGIKGKLMMTADNKIIPAEKHGIKVVSMAGMCATEDEPIVWRGPITTKILQQMLKESMWGNLDVLIIDFPSGTGDVPLTILQQFEVDGAIIITTPQANATVTAHRTINMVQMLEVPVIGIVENMRGDIFGEGGSHQLADKAGVPLIVSIPLRKPIVSMGDQGIPSVFHSEELASLIGKIARATFEKIVV